MVIGDPCQLRHISILTKVQESRLADITSASDLLADWSYSSNSLYDVAEGASISFGEKPILLAEHYRSHPDIIDFSNRTFYGRALVLRTKIPLIAEKLDGLDLGVFWHDIKGKVAKTTRSAYNDEEINEIVRILAQWAQSGLLSKSNFTMGIITPFRLQMERIEQAIKKQAWFDVVKGKIRVGTAHRFQGDEADLVFFSPVVSEGIHPRKAQWVAKTDQLLNVAITRARGALHIIGDVDACLIAGGFLAEFARYSSESKQKAGPRHPFDSPAEEKLAELLDSVGIWYHPQYSEGRYRLDFFVVSPFGTRYDLEVDGRQHWTSERLSYDEVRDKTLEEVGYKIIRIKARDVLSDADKVRLFLTKLI